MDEIALTPLALDDAQAVLAFELENRVWFETWVGPRPDSYWRLDSLREIIRGQLDDPDLMFLIRRGDRIAGRLNMTSIEAGIAQLGYRVGQSDCGQGVARHAVRMAQDVARAAGLWALEARAKHDNPASVRVLERTGFHPVSTADGMTLFRGALA